VSHVTHRMSHFVHVVSVCVCVYESGVPCQVELYPTATPVSHVTHRMNYVVFRAGERECMYVRCPVSGRAKCTCHGQNKSCHAKNESCHAKNESCHGKNESSRTLGKCVCVRAGEVSRVRSSYIQRPPL